MKNLLLKTVIFKILKINISYTYFFIYYLLFYNDSNNSNKMLHYFQHHHSLLYSIVKIDPSAWLVIGWPLNRLD